MAYEPVWLVLLLIQWRNHHVYGNFLEVYLCDGMSRATIRQLHFRHRISILDQYDERKSDLCNHDQTTNLWRLVQLDHLFWMQFEYPKCMHPSLWRTVNWWWNLLSVESNDVSTLVGRVLEQISLMFHASFVWNEFLQDTNTAVCKNIDYWNFHKKICKAKNKSKKHTQTGAGYSKISQICRPMLTLSLSNDRSRNTNSANFQDQPIAGTYWMTFLAYALQFPNTPNFSHNDHPINQSMSYEWFTSRRQCSLPKYFFCTSSSQ